MKKLSTLMIGCTFLVMAFASPSPQPMSDAELANVTGGMMSIECDKCVCDMTTNICNCTGCKIVFKP